MIKVLGKYWWLLLIVAVFAIAHLSVTCPTGCNKVLIGSCECSHGPV